MRMRVFLLVVALVLALPMLAKTDTGRPGSQGWVDVDGDDRPDFCRVVGNKNGPHYLWCDLSSNGATAKSQAVDAGFELELPRSWVRTRANVYFCRFVKSLEDPQNRCTVIVFDKNTNTLSEK